MSFDAMPAMPQPVVSFLVLCGDNRPYLLECVQSILGQSFIDLEVLLLVDAPSAETAAVAQAWEAADPRVRQVRLENPEGRHQLWDAGIAQSRGELVWFMASEHCLASPHVVQDWMTQFILNPRLGFAFCRAQCMDENSVPYEAYLPHKKDSDLPYQPTLFPGHLFFRQLLRENLLAPSSVIARKVCYQHLGSFQAQSQLQTQAEWLHWMCFSLDWDVFFDPEPKVYCRQAKNQAAVSRKTPQALADILACYQALEDYLQQGRYPRNLKRQAQLARLQFMRRKGMRMSAYERMMRWYRKLAARLFDPHPAGFHPA